ncbi:MAG: metallophosphoesterase [Gloeobacteraceae cyanobacterium ES-bin-316]|nr:metallophosphoesterase [Ferruginibacter sp.]
MRKILQYLLKRPLTWMGNKLAASPKREMVFNSLTALYQQGLDQKGNAVKTIEVNLLKDKFIIFSDQHKGNKSWADDFNISEVNYVAALKFYNNQNFHFINLGDSEELWKFKAPDILPANEKSIATEAAFHPGRYTKTFGNHDIIWKDKFAVAFYLKKYFDPLPLIYEGVILKILGLNIPLNILLTHGHQGDLMSDNNSLSTWLVAHIWMPLQRFLRININSASKDFSLRNLHNKMMYEWSSKRKNLLLVTGHTHKPVFASGRYYNHPAAKIETSMEHYELLPVYFNSGCCCFDDGDITGIEIAEGYIRLIKWYDDEGGSKRRVLEEITLEKLITDLQ